MEVTPTVFQSLLDIVSCPVCFERLKPPTTCCINGHAVCTKCKKKLTKCPKCNGKFSEEKHTTLSQILEALPFACKFEGCSELSQDIDYHNKWCGFRPTSCKRCHWTGSANKLKWHITLHTLQHNGVNHSHHIDRDFYWSYARVQFDQVFWDIRELNVKKNIFSIQLIWVPTGEITEEKFKMKIMFESKNSNLTADLKVQFDPDNRSDNVNRIVFHTDALKPFVNQHHHISYRFHLMKDN